MPFKDKKKRKEYMAKYMRKRRARERNILKELRIKFPDISKQIEKDLGLNPCPRHKVRRKKK